ncbi:MAG: hypothetical protein U9O54_01305 [Chloroflexota bacterium]|nr:hypothetical protein [Chloroflexota bacterium]
MTQYKENNRERTLRILREQGLLGRWGLSGTILLRMLPILAMKNGGSD